LRGLTNPWPSSSNSRYSCGTPPARSAATTRSASSRRTRGSRPPCATRTGMRTSRMRDSGERSQSMAASASGFPDPLVHPRGLRAPRAGDGPQERPQVGGRRGGDRASEDVRRVGCREQRGVAAEGGAVDPGAPRVGVPPGRHPGERVEQVILHARSPLPVSRVTERFPISRRSPVVHLETQVAAVGEPLRLGPVPPAVSRPRPAMHAEHDGQVAVRPSRREGEISVDGQPVARGEGKRLHAGERQSAS
jgi:hypothetical protein